jgi:hypothetical protein
MELAFWSLTQINDYLAKYRRRPISGFKFDRHDDELWVGWIVGRFLESMNHKEYLLALPFKEDSAPVTLDNIQKSKAVLEDDTLDVALMEKQALYDIEAIDWSKLYRIQIKRYVNRPQSTDDCVSFMKQKLCIAPDKNLNFVILLETGFEIDVAKMREFTANYKFNFGSVWLVGYYLNKKLDPFLLPIFPDFTGVTWKPSRTNT